MNRDTRPRAFAFWIPIRIRMPRPDESFMRKLLPNHPSAPYIPSGLIGAE
ncbi:hypothetical protein JOE46_002121 [Rhodococcus sp. PvR099]|nr:hypothetical protein [Rhodococcus sp. PvR099]